jgi:phage gp46-like protein
MAAAAMTEILLRENEGCEPDSTVLWDTVWTADQVGDWQLAPAAGEPGNCGGLVAHAGLFTAAILCLFTDLRVPVNHPLAWLADGDPRGWWGDGVDVRTDLGETPMGSLLWLLERAPMQIRGVPVEVWAQQLAAAALQPMINQGMVAKITTEATADPALGHLYLQVGMFGANGAQVFNQQFELYWRQIFRGTR